MFSKKILLVPALVVALAAAGCGGNDSPSASNKGGIEALKVSQANADVKTFCVWYTAPKEQDTWQRPYLAMLDAVDTLIEAYKKDPNLKVPLDHGHQNVPGQEVVKKRAAQLQRCGSEGRQQAGRLQQVIQTS